MSSISLLVLELLENNQLTFLEAETILKALENSKSAIVKSSQTIMKRNKKESVSYPPHYFSYMNPNTLQNVM